MLCVVSLLALHVGTIMIPIGGGIQSILNGMGIPVNFTEPITAEQEAVLWFIRMPRLIIGLLVGGALALAGAVMQGVFSNPSRPWYYGRICRGIPRCRYRYCTGCNISRHVLHAAFAFVGAFVSVGITILLTLRNKQVRHDNLIC